MRVLLIIGLLLSSLACSRAGLSSKLSLSLPSRDQGGFATEDTLVKTIMVVHIEGRSPIVHEDHYQPGEVPRGQDFNADLNSVPVGTSYFIQFLAVYDNSLTGGVKVLYGHTSGVAQKQNEIEITAQNVSLSDKMVRIAGRYLSAPGTGPTGTITAFYQPPLSHPAIAFDQFPIQDGWFEISAPDADVIGSFRFNIGGNVLFTSLDPTNPQLSVFGSEFLRVEKPLSFHLANGQTIPTPATALYLGFWGQVAGESMCYIDVQEPINGEFRDQNLMLPLEYKVQSPTPVMVRPVAGGIAHSYATYPTSSCSLRFDHQAVSKPQPYIH